MRRKHLILILLIAAIFAGLVIVIVSETEEPVYHDRPLSYWLKELRLVSEEYSVTNEPVVAIQTIGTNALPYLLKQLGTKPSRFKTWINKIVAKQSLIDLRIESGREHGDAQIGILTLEGKAKSAIPALTRLAQDPDLVMGVAPLLAHFGRDGYLALTNCFTNTSALVRFTAVGNLRRLGETNAAILSDHRRDIGVAIPALLGRLHDSNTNVAGSAARALGEIRQDADIVVPALNQLVADTNTSPYVRKAALVALKRFGPPQ